MRLILITLILSFTVISCSPNRPKEENAIPLTPTEGEESEEQPDLSLVTRPSSVLLTGHPEHRLITVYKIDPETGGRGINSFHRKYTDNYDDDDNVDYRHFMPGIVAAYGYQMFNVAHYNLKTKERKNLFDDPVLINTLYYPSFIKDTIDKQPIERDYYLISVYDEDTNKDDRIDGNDLRRFYHFDLDAKQKTLLIPSNYSVISSEYDSENDLMYIFAGIDENENGNRELDEDIHIFWIDLKSPKQGERLY